VNSIVLLSPQVRFELPAQQPTTTQVQNAPRYDPDAYRREVNDQWTAQQRA